MPVPADFRALGQLSAYGAAIGAVIGGGIAAALTVPFLLMASTFGLLVLTIPAFSVGQAVGVVTGFLSPTVAVAAVAIIHPRTERGVQGVVASTVAAFCALPAGIAIAVLGVPLSLYRGYPNATLIIVSVSMLVAAIAAWRLAPAIFRPAGEVAGGRAARVGWWLIAVGLLPTISSLAVYVSAWVDLNVTFSPEPQEDQPVDATLVFALALIDSAVVVLLATGIALVWRTRQWLKGELVVGWATAGFATALLSGFGFWILVGESLA
jgi:hypothetical protein